MPGEHDQTIAALSTPPGESGIAVVRISGSHALPILSTIFRTKDGSIGKDAWEHRRLYHGVIYDGASEAIDDVICAVMRSPESYTGEDVVEISCHGNTLLVSRILRLIFDNGARSAEPGEFTKRAFLNGKIDLIQAEAVSDLIHAKSELQRKVAREQLSGTLSNRINRLAEELLDLLGIVEANIDFIEEGIETLDFDAAVSMVKTHRQELGDLLEWSSLSRPFREGYRVVIAGPVNAGKSSIFNRLIGENRAIVTEVPGTTRDVIREPIVVDGLLFVLQDTAGLRGTRDLVESIGVDLAETTAGEADVVVFVVDGSEPLSTETCSRLERLESDRSFVVVNKIDLPAEVTAGRLKTTYPRLRIISVSVETGDGFGELKQTLVESVGRDQLNWIARERVVLNSRLISLLEGAKTRLASCEKSFAGRAPLEILALEVREVLSLYETATGKRYTDDLLDSIFSRFCIGK
ncbi:MAG: tRNA uridine-5-carboxymethylaminomethyl(34) synthesis GTPase MnmE [Candidatus Latescibacterota bacterium]|nr:MAG: tRNA uridine-5-carboxymethylaminomethyl(34) synthesis GTPase MnmE [Candidatus Latescibacterota bacterium]